MEVTPSPRCCDRRVATGAECILVIEVSNSSVQVDRKKLQDHARLGVGIVWIVDLVARTLEIHSQPVDGEYSLVQVIETPSTPVGLPGQEATVTLAELMGTVVV